MKKLILDVESLAVLTKEQKKAFGGKTTTAAVRA